MKKVICILLMGVSIVFLFACGSSIDNNTKSNTIENETSSIKNETQQEVIKKSNDDDIQNIIKQFNDVFGAIMKSTDPCIKALSVSKEPEDENVIVNIIVYDTTDAKTAMDIADSVLRQLNTAASLIDSKYELSSDNYYGNFYDEYPTEIRVTQSCNVKNIDLWYICDTISNGYDMVQLQNTSEVDKKQSGNVLSENTISLPNGTIFSVETLGNELIVKTRTYDYVNKSSYGKYDGTVVTVEQNVDDIISLVKTYFDLDADETFKLSFSSYFDECEIDKDTKNPYFSVTLDSEIINGIKNDLIDKAELLTKISIINKFDMKKYILDEELSTDYMVAVLQGY